MTKTDANQRALDEWNDVLRRLPHFQNSISLSTVETIRTALETAQKHKDFIDALPEETTVIGIDNALTRPDNEVIREVVDILKTAHDNNEGGYVKCEDIEQALEKLKELGDKNDKSDD